MCGREPNFELSEDEKRELSKFKWEEFLTVTRQTITCKKHKKSRSPGLVDVEPSSNRGDCAVKQVVTDFSVSGEAEQEIDVSRNL
ncbi:ethylene-responsive transcription factor-like protein [Trifolium medium]|uniref:Ethylene-responsive transcription factor-like protein n=1 Tax=Trifolium medium TaxID=97028 RepID=A0A392PZ19_9FABA|nr:ethylene-responsive transcription factor-like protein [Trifolium medium]